MNVTKGRISYIDVAKGILIAIVVMGHIPSHAKLGGVYNVSLDFLKSIDFWYIPFFMPGFFVITGFCSNQEKSIKDYFLSNLKTTLFPGIVLCFLTKFLGTILHKDDEILSLFSIKLWIAWPTLFWFFSAMFLAKEIYYFTNRVITNSYLKFLIMFCIMIIGVVLGRYLTFVPNIWFCKQAMTFSIFIMIGHYIRNLEIPFWHLKMLGFFYPFLITILLLFSISVPGIGYNFRLSLYQIPIYLILAVSGTLFVINISKTITRSKVLSFMGFWSGVIYGTHFFILDNIVVPSIKLIYYPYSEIQGYIFYFLAGLLVIVFCTILIVLLNHKYTRLLLGKL